MLCTDDSHPDELISDGHIDRLIRLGLKSIMWICLIYLGQQVLSLLSTIRYLWACLEKVIMQTFSCE